MAGFAFLPRPEPHPIVDDSEPTLLPATVEASGYGGVFDRADAGHGVSGHAGGAAPTAFPRRLIGSG